MNNLINTIGIAIITGKYAILVLLAGVTIAAGVPGADPAVVIGFNNDN